jgi:hypothetical protein
MRHTLRIPAVAGLPKAEVPHSKNKLSAKERKRVAKIRKELANLEKELSEVLEIQ